MEEALDSRPNSCGGSASGAVRSAGGSEAAWGALAWVTLAALERGGGGVTRAVSDFGGPASGAAEGAVSGVTGDGRRFSRAGGAGAPVAAASFLEEVIGGANFEEETGRVGEAVAP